MESLPTNLKEWRETFPNGITWPVVEACYKSGLMREERYLSLYNQYSRAIHVPVVRTWVDPELRDMWRCYWEPKFKGSQNAPDAAGEAQA
ncbi:hypothetical protein KXY27_004549 [Salmonella enterica]|nr:hypothetical protein [Salmonella enterica]EHU5767747.1 hypothetical protein [Salmonella enterica]